MPVRFTGPSGPQSIIPAPLVSIDKKYVKGPDGKTLYTDYTFILTGYVFDDDLPLNSPGTGGETASLDGVLGGEKFIRELFTGEGGRLEIESPDYGMGGGGPNTLDAYCKILDVSFEKGLWVQLANYTVTLNAQKIESSTDPVPLLETFNESWKVQELEDQTFTISHELSAKGLLSFASGVPNNPLQNAKNWVQQRIYTTSTSGTLDPNPNASGFNFNLNYLIVQPSSLTNNYWNRVITESADPANYVYDFTENFIYNPTGNAKDLWTASVQYQQDNIRRANISINGDITGYSDKLSDLDLRNGNASGYFINTVLPNIYLRAVAFAPSGFTVNPQPITKQIAYERPVGQVKYSYSFMSNNGTLIPNAAEESFTVNDVGMKDVFAQIPVPGRANGPVFQYMFTKTAPERTVSISATLVPDPTPLTTGSLLSMYLAKPNTDALFSIVQPNIGNYYVSQNSEEWNPIRRQYGRTVVWTIQNNGTLPNGTPIASGNPSLI